MKVQKSYRIEEDLVKDLDELVSYYKQDVANKAGVPLKISPAIVIEMLITQKVREIREEKAKSPLEREQV